MKVAFFQPYLANWRIEFLQRFIGESQHEVTVYDGGFSSRKDRKAVTGNKADFPVKCLWSWSPVLSLRGQAYPVYFSPGLFFRLIIDRPDCVITEGEINFLNNLSVLLYCRLFSRHYVWWSLGKVRTRYRTVANRLLDPIIDYLLRQADCVMARNGYARDYFVTKKNIPADRVIVAPNSMDEDRAWAELTERRNVLRNEAGGRVILYVGALVVEKRPADLIEVLSLLKSRGRTDVHVWFVGDGPERPRLEALAADAVFRTCVFLERCFEELATTLLTLTLLRFPDWAGW